MSLTISSAGKRVLITGGANGLGRTLVQKFHEGNAQVFTVDRDQAALDTLKSEFPNVTCAAVDLSDWDATRKIIESFGTMDYLVNCAGVFMGQPFLDVTEDILLKLFKINFAATLNVSQVVAKGMIASKNGGSIVNISSISGGIEKAAFGVGGCVYAGTKAAVKSLTKNMALELGPHNIRVNCIIPGPIDTDMFRSAMAKVPQEQAESFSNGAIIKRPAESSEAADLICFLLSPLASMITGEGVIIDGGHAIG